ncbi:outer membrane protein assembly factor BamE [Roseisalinus antarcticus]|uniref:SmpA / OmlA family protein n=1 Tax=Roseisalinus antarcticus TaxID=254357 RepID=A0A1Y5RJA1_9RHOB|nr:outer membrane protein assembly factor BamE [Roseisalinus antarcticus]SLN18853.1 SmpA / OmlA family protein [Roseisalinus antarcticus]
MSNGPDLTSRRVRGAVVAVALALVVGCTPIYRNHGFVPSETELVEVQPGVDTRDSVVEIIGQPTAGGVLNDGGFYYVQSRFRHFGPLEPTEVDRVVLAITFDDGGVVRNIERFGLEQGRVVELSRRVTDDNIRDTTFIRQLIGNLGNFDPAQILGGDR